MADAVSDHKRAAGENGQPTLLALPPGTFRRAVIMAVQAFHGCSVHLVAVSMIMVVRMRMIAVRPMCVFRRGLVPRQGGTGRHDIAKARHLPADRVQVTRRIVLDPHRACGDGHRHVGHTRHAAHRRIDLAGAGRAIHAFDPETRLFYIGHHTILFIVVRMVYDL